MITTFIIIAVTAAFFVWGKIRSDIVALCALLALILTNTLTTGEALSGFSNSTVIMMAGLFIVGGAIFQTGLARMISLKILALAGGSQLRLFLLIMLVTGGIGSFVSNTGTVALMLPIVISLASEANANPRRFLMPLAFASSMGGMMTLIGTPPNLIINDALVSAGYDGLSFFSFLPVGLIALTLGIICLWPMSKLLISKKEKEDEKKKNKEKSLSDLATEYQIVQHLYRIKVPASSALANQTLKDLNITQKYNVSVLQTTHEEEQSRRRFQKVSSIKTKIASAKTKILANDILDVFGNEDKVMLFVEENKLQLLSNKDTAAETKNKKGLEFKQMGIAEVVLLSTSSLVNKKVKDTEFRNLYNVNILGIQRKNQYILQDVKDEKMQAGDVLLVQGLWSDIDKLNTQNSDWVVIGQPMEKAEKIPLSHKAPFAAIIMVAMVVAMVFEWVAPVTAVLIASVLMILTGCFRNVESAYKTINWESIVLFAAMIPISIAMENTGGSKFIANTIVNGLGGYGNMVVLAGIYMATMCLTMFISNTATAVLFAPIAVQSANALGVSPLPFLFAVTVAASMCFASPFSTPPNALVMSAGRYTFMDYVKVGLPLQIIYAIVMILVLPLIFPF